MGSPLFGSITFPGFAFELADRLFGEAMAFSPDSRFLAISELISSQEGPESRVVAFDFVDRIERVAMHSIPGITRRISWSDARTIDIRFWSYESGERAISARIEGSENSA